MSEKLNGCVWTNEAVTLLLSLYLREKQQDRPVKLKKKEIWKSICAELWSRGLMCSWQECDKKYRNLKQTFVRNLKQAGKKECRWLFFPIMLEINKHEPFVNEMVGNAFANNVSSSNTSTSDYENDESSSDETKMMNIPSPIPHDFSINPLNIPLHHIHQQQQPQIRPFHEYATGRATLNPMVMKRPSKSPSPQRQNSPQNSSPFLSPKQERDDSLELSSQSKKVKTVVVDSSEPPEWFKMFMLEYHRSENRKFQQIKELCESINRKNEIEDQRNAILNEKNDLLKNLIDYMSTK